MLSEKSRENKLRRALYKADCLMRKSRADISIDNFGGYMIVDVKTNAVIAGSRFNLDLDDVEGFVKACV